MAATDTHAQLRADPDPTVDAALAAALPTAKADERAELIGVILKRGNLKGLTAAVEWADLDDPAQRSGLILAGERDLDGAIRTLLDRGHGQGCDHALELVRACRLTRLAYLLTGLIRHGDDGQPDRAAAVLVELAQEDELEAADLASLCQAIDEAVAAYDRHRHPGILEVFLRLLPHPMPRAFAALRDQEHAAVRTLRPMIENADAPWVRRALLPLCAWPALARSAAAGLNKAAARDGLSDLLTHAHVIDEPGVANALQHMTEHEALLPLPPHSAALAPEARRWLPALWSALPIKPGRLVQMLDTLRDASDRGTRLAAVRAADAMFDQTLDTDVAAARRQLFVAFAHDADASVARLAARALDRASVRAGRPGDHAGLAGSAHASVRAAAGVRLGPALFDKLWASPKRQPPSVLGAALRALRKLDPGFDARLAARLAVDSAATQQSQPADPARALRFVSMLGCPGPFVAATLALTSHDDARTVASAATALADCDDPAGAARLGELTEHADARVRANAIEALAQLRADDAAPVSFAAWADDHAPRPRANAIRALFSDDYTAGLRALSEMLRDDRPEHRRSALWLARIAGLLDRQQQSDTPDAHAAQNTIPASTPPPPSRGLHPDEIDEQAATVHELLAELYGRADDDQGAAA